MNSYKQICPYCGCTEEECYANWDSDSDGTVTCSKCNKDYYSMPQYRFEGWQVEKICEECGEKESECFCEEEEK